MNLCTLYICTYFFITIRFWAIIKSMKASRPFCLINSIEAGRSDLKISEKISETKLLNFLHSRGFVVEQSAQVAYPFSIQQARALHQVAFALAWHPAHLPFLNFPQLPQYRPQLATRTGFFSLSVFMAIH